MNLTPVQERTLVELMGSRDERPLFDRGLADHLRAELERRLEPAVAGVPDGEALWVTKNRLTDLLLRCEGLFVANERGEGEFEYSLPLAKGNLAHKAVEVGVYRSALSDAELVEKSLEQLRRDDGRFDQFVSGLDDADLAELEAEAVRRTALFRATVPPLERGWSPIVELPLKVELAGGRIILYTRPDLSLGAEDPEEPMRARRLLLELKTGMERPEHDEDLRFYALCATLRFGVPPFRVATVLLEDGSWRAQDVTPDLLESAVRRVADSCTRAAELLAGDSGPVLRPGAWCSWCPRRTTCPESAA